MFPIVKEVWLCHLFHRKESLWFWVNVCLWNTTLWGRALIPAYLWLAGILTFHFFAPKEGQENQFNRFFEQTLNAQKHCGVLLDYPNNHSCIVLVAHSQGYVQVPHDTVSTIRNRTRMFFWRLVADVKNLFVHNYLPWNTSRSGPKPKNQRMDSFYTICTGSHSHLLKNSRFVGAEAPLICKEHTGQCIPVPTSIYNIN